MCECSSQSVIVKTSTQHHRHVPLLHPTAMLTAPHLDSAVPAASDQPAAVMGSRVDQCGCCHCVCMCCPAAKCLANARCMHHNPSGTAAREKQRQGMMTQRLRWRSTAVAAAHPHTAVCVWCPGCAHWCCVTDWQQAQCQWVFTWRQCGRPPHTQPRCIQHAQHTPLASSADCTALCKRNRCQWPSLQPYTAHDVQCSG